MFFVIYYEKHYVKKNIFGGVRNNHLNSPILKAPSLLIENLNMRSFSLLYQICVYQNIFTSYTELSLVAIVECMNSVL